VYNLASITLENGYAPQLGNRLTEWDNVNVQDLSSLFVLLVEAAALGWDGENGYFLAENGYHVWGEVSHAVAEAAYRQGYIKTMEIKVMSQDKAKEKPGFEALSWGLNSKGFAKRARKVLGWNPTGKNLKECIPDIVDGEAERLGLKSGRERVKG
jgi:hypothetical protein